MTGSDDSIFVLAMIASSVDLIDPGVVARLLVLRARHADTLGARN